MALGAAGLAGAALLTVSALTPAGAALQYVAFAAGAMAAGPVFAAYPGLAGRAVLLAAESSGRPASTRRQPDGC